MVEVNEFALKDVLEFVLVATDLGHSEAVLNELDLSDEAFTMSWGELDAALGTFVESWYEEEE